MTAASAVETRASVARPLSERLRAIPPDRAAAITRLLGAGSRLLAESDDLQLELRGDVDQLAPQATTIHLGHANGRIPLVFAHEGHGATVGDRSWHDFGGDARLLAWALAYEPLLTRLADLLGTPLLPLELRNAPERDADVWHWVEFRFSRQGNEQVRGLVGLDEPTLDALAGAPGWHRADSDTRVDRNEVPFPCHLLMPVTDVTAALLRELGVGDVILLGSRSLATSTLRFFAHTGAPSLDARHAWLASASAGGISITRPLSAAELRNLTMTESEPEPIADDSAEVPEADVRDTVPVRVDLLLDTITLTLAELSAITAGQTLELHQPVEGMHVELRANGAVFGSGELVSLGETLGVKVTRIGGARGLQ